MKYEIQTQAMRLWQFRTAAFGIFLLLADIMLIGSRLLLRIISGITVILFGIVIFVYLPKLFKSFSFKLNKSSVIFEAGVFIKRIHIFPLTRLIYTQAYRTPLSVKMGLTSIGLKAARNRIIIPELFDSDAQELMTLLTGGEENEA